METLHLTNETIDYLSAKVHEMYLRNHATKKEALRARLLLEETLIKYQNHFNAEIELYYREYKIFSQSRFVIRIKAPAFDPYTLEENPMAFMLESVISSFEGNIPTWKYHNLENEIVFTIRRKAMVNSIVKIGIGLGISVAAAIPLRIFVPNDTLTSFVQDYLEPFANAYAGLFSIMAVLLSFFAIVLSIVRIGDMNAVGNTSGRIMRRFYGMMAALVILLTLPVLPFYEIGTGGNLSVAAKSIYDILIGFIPSELVAPFLNFNSVHIMIIGIMFGFSLLIMGQKGETTVKLFNEGNTVAIMTNNFLNKFIAFYVALKVFSLITTGDFSELAGAGKLVAMILIAEFLLLVFYTIYVTAKCKIPIREYIRKMAPMFIVCLSSANFGAAFSSICDGIIAVDDMDETTSISLSFGGVVFRPACAIVFVFSALAMASFYQIEISVLFVVMAIILSIILMAAVPNIPGVSVSMITLLFAQLGLPAEAVALMITINAPLQFLTVAVDTWCLAAESVMLTQDIRKKKSVFRKKRKVL